MTSSPAPEEAIREQLRALANEAAPGPWQECGHGKEDGCPCGFIWSIPADAPIATATVGEWGDEYPTIVEAADGEPQAVMRRHVYGEVSKAKGIANARYIAAANPQTVLGLLDEIDQLRAAIAAWNRRAGGEREQQLEAAAREVVNFAWSLCSCSPPEALANINGLLNNLRAALAGQTEGQ